MRTKISIMRFYLSILISIYSINIFAQNIPEDIKGNWFNSKGNWIITITDKRVIYQNQFWEYQVVNNTDQSISLQLYNHIKLKQLSIFLIDSLNIKIVYDTNNEILSKSRNTKSLIQNNEVSNQPEFVTINGLVDNSKKYPDFNNLNLGFSNWLTGNYKELFAEIDSSGFFSITFMQYYPEEFSISYRNRYVRLYMVPGDTITVFINAEEFPDNFLVMSNHADMAYNVADFEVYSGERVNYNSRIEQEKSQLLDSKSYKLWRDSLKNEDMRYVSQYLLKNNSSTHFRNWLTNKYKYQYITDIIENYTRERQSNNSEPFSEFYLSLLDSIDLSSSSGSNYAELYSVINRYNNFYYYLSMTKPETKGILLNFSDNILNNTQISLNPAEVKSKPEMKLIAKKESVSVDEYILEVKSVKNDLLKDALIANCFYRYKNYYNPDSLAYKIYSNMETDIAKASFYEEYMQRKELKINENNIAFETDEGRELLNGIINKHKNKVLYIDFWGTFCGPCITDFKYASKLKEYYRGKDVAFIYLCERGDEKRWNDIIKDLKVSGDHYLLNNRQYVGLSKMFNLTYVPRYILIDKTGKIIDADAPRPWNELEIRHIIDKNL